MKRFWIGTAAVAVIGLVFCLITMEVEWRHPSGPPGKIQVHYTIPVTMPNGEEGHNGFSFWIAGHVEKVQLVPTSGHNENGFVMLYIKTSQGWYETPTASLAGPVDWKRGVEVHFHYPEGMVLREQTRSPIHGFYPAFGSLRWRGSPFGFGDHLDDGDIAGVHFRNTADGTQVTVHRTNGLKHSGYQSWEHPGMAVEVTVSDK